MSEIKHAQLPFELCNHIDAVEHTTTMCVMIPKLGKVKIPFSYKPGETDATAEFIVEACNNYYKLKEQNEKLKEQIRQTEAWLSFNPHPDKDQIRVFRNSMIELLKSCES